MFQYFFRLRIARTLVILAHLDGFGANLVLFHICECLLETHLVYGGVVQLTRLPCACILVLVCMFGLFMSFHLGGLVLFALVPTSFVNDIWCCLTPFPFVCNIVIVTMIVVVITIIVINVIVIVNMIMIVVALLVLGISSFDIDIVYYHLIGSGH